MIAADAAVTNLRRFRVKGVYRAGNGRHGEGQKKHGKNGKDLRLAVPPGTIITTRTAEATGNLAADLEEAGQSVMVVRGGKGGWGNSHFVSSTNQAPYIAQRGAPGEENQITLEMRLIADVGIVGYPNAGKSTLLAAASAARPKIADYPFTTLEPVLGVVQAGKESFTLAEIPGLIEGAHLGRGLGHEFLRHAMRTRLLIHLIDASSASPVEDMVHLNAELGLYDPALAAKPQVVVFNKIDLPEVQARLPELREVFESVSTSPLFISAATGEGVPDLMARVAVQLGKAKREKAEAPPKVFRPQPRANVSVHKDGDTFVLVAPELERIVTRGGMTGAEVRWQLKRHLARMGVNRALQKAGVKTGDKVRCGNLEWEW